MNAAAIRQQWLAARAVVGIVRAPDWWEFKLAPPLAIFWAVLVAHRAPLLPFLASAALLLGAISTCAVFVSVINDLTDLRVDRLAGKANRMAPLSRPVRAALLGLSALLGVAIAARWRPHPALAAAYLGSFVAFILYSVPPFRLKGRGLLGVIADAAGAHLFPTLVAVLLALAVLPAPVDPLLLALAATWAFAFGLRGILWHQLGDIAADSRASIRTLPRIFPPDAVVRWGERVVFPIELAALLLLLWVVQAPLALFFLALHGGTLWRRFRHDGRGPAIVAPRPRAAIALHEYYALWLPAALILQSGLRHPADLPLLLLVALLFPSRSRQLLADLRPIRPLRPT